MGSHEHECGQEHGRHDPEHHDVKPGLFCWNELGTTNIDVCKKFYTQLFGWTTQEHSMGKAGMYTVFRKDNEQIGGMFKMEGPQYNAVSPHWVSYVGVTNVDEWTKKATALGGKVLVEPMDIPEVGRFSIIADPTGARVALFQGLK